MCNQLSIPMEFGINLQSIAMEFVIDLQSIINLICNLFAIN